MKKNVIIKNRVYVCNDCEEFFGSKSSFSNHREFHSCKKLKKVSIRHLAVERKVFGDVLKCPKICIERWTNETDDNRAKNCGNQNPRKSNLYNLECQSRRLYVRIGADSLVIPKKNAGPPPAPSVTNEGRRKGPLRCKKCPYMTIFVENLRRHYSKEHESKKVFNCSNCGFSSSSSEDIRKHLEKAHPKNKIDCNNCEYKAPSIHDIYIHNLQKHRKHINVHSCRKCGEKFPTRDAWLIHRWNHKNQGTSCNMSDDDVILVDVEQDEIVSPRPESTNQMSTELLIGDKYLTQDEAMQNANSNQETVPPKSMEEDDVIIIESHQQEPQIEKCMAKEDLLFKSDEKDAKKISESEKCTEKVLENENHMENDLEGKKVFEKIPANKKDMEKIPENVNCMGKEPENVVDMEKCMVKDLQNEKDMEKVPEKKKSMEKLLEKENCMEKVTENEEYLKKCMENDLKNEIKKVSENEKCMIKVPENKEDMEKCMENDLENEKGMEKIPKNEKGMEKFTENEKGVEKVVENEINKNSMENRGQVKKGDNLMTNEDIIMDDNCIESQDNVVENEMKSGQGFIAENSTRCSETVKTVMESVGNVTENDKKLTKSGERVIENEKAPKNGENDCENDENIFVSGREGRENEKIVGIEKEYEKVLEGWKVKSRVEFLYSRTFRCDLCSFEFIHPTFLERHVSFEHEKQLKSEQLRCKLCRIICDNDLALIHHMKRHQT